MSDKEQGFVEKHGNAAVMAIVGAAFLYVWQAPEKTSSVLTTVQSSLAAIQEGQKATREDIGKLSQKLDTTADGLADVKAEVAGIKAAQATAEQEQSRLRDRMREYETEREVGKKPR